MSWRSSQSQLLPIRSQGGMEGRQAIALNVHADMPPQLSFYAVKSLSRIDFHILPYPLLKLLKLRKY